MSTIDLILLGLVMEQPRSAYEIQKNVEYRNLDKWVKVSMPSIYKKVIRLESQGYLKSDVIRVSKMPEKTTYSITVAGREYFFALMGRITRNPVHVLLDFNGVIANLNKVPKDEGLLLLASIRQGVADNLQFMMTILPQRQDVPLVGRGIITQQIKILEALLAWVDEFSAEFKAEDS